MLEIGGLLEGGGGAGYPSQGSGGGWHVLRRQRGVDHSIAISSIQQLFRQRGALTILIHFVLVMVHGQETVSVQTANKKVNINVQLT